MPALPRTTRPLLTQPSISFSPSPSVSGLFSRFFSEILDLGSGLLFRVIVTRMSTNREPINFRGVYANHTVLGRRPVTKRELRSLSDKYSHSLLTPHPSPPPFPQPVVFSALHDLCLCAILQPGAPSLRFSIPNTCRAISTFCVHVSLRRGPIIQQGCAVNLRLSTVFSLVLSYQAT